VKIVIEEPLGDEEEQIIIKCRVMRPEILNLINALKSHEVMLTAYINNEIHIVLPSDIYYIETVDNKTFLYCKNEVYESKQKLYEMEEMLGTGDFLRISKSVIINLSKIKSLSPALSGRLEAVLRNGEKVIISRQYVGALKKKLGI